MAERAIARPVGPEGVEVTTCRDQPLQSRRPEPPGRDAIAFGEPGGNQRLRPAADRATEVGPPGHQRYAGDQPGAAEKGDGLTAVGRGDVGRQGSGAVAQVTAAKIVYLRNTGPRSVAA